ncbi:MAG: hypothetical protein GWM91_27865, partial [Actinobacteria bacterium]|nr:hypothetical protein [Actinomycetota bacterium]NIV59191.1 hypothetical protein [Actinomycetota bacterium]NIX53967.1 hypothetical protein [Actinomycetota bacterium]
MDVAARGVAAGEVAEAAAADGSPGDAEAALRRRLAAKVFRHMSAYDDAVAEYLDDGASAGAATV